MKYLVKFNEHADPGFTQQFPSNTEELDEINDIFLGIADEYFLIRSEPVEETRENNWSGQMDNTYSIMSSDKFTNGVSNYEILINYCPGVEGYADQKMKAGELYEDVISFGEKLKKLLDIVDVGIYYDDNYMEEEEFKASIKIRISTRGTYGLALHGSK